MKELLGFPVAFFVCYLFGAFVYASFDIMLWDMVGRAMCVFFSICWGLALAIRIRMEYLYG